MKMSEDEINSQFGMITVAGEDTTVRTPFHNIHGRQ
jgi:cytochrome P450